MASQTILVAYDFSDPATRALTFANELRQQLGARLHLVYVLPDPYNGRADLSLVLPAPMGGEGERYVLFLQQELQRSAAELASGADAVCHVVLGDAVQRIVELSQELGADFVCIAATGKGAVERMMLGSVAQRLLRSSAVPVILVP